MSEDRGQYTTRRTEDSAIGPAKPFAWLRTDAQCAARQGHGQLLQLASPRWVGICARCLVSVVWRAHDRNQAAHDLRDAGWAWIGAWRCPECQGAEP